MTTMSLCDGLPGKSTHAQNINKTERALDATIKKRVPNFNEVW